MPTKIVVRMIAVVIGLMVAPITLGLSLILIMMGGIVSVGAIAFAALIGELFELLERPLIPGRRRCPEDLLARSMFVQEDRDAA